MKRGDSKGVHGECSNPKSSRKMKELKMPSSTSETLHVLVIGGSGLVGSHFIHEAQNSIMVSKITVISRREALFFKQFDKVNLIIEPEPLLWCKWIQGLGHIDVLFSALGATRGDAGSISAQRAVDYDLNMMVAQQAKLKGAKMCVLVSCFNNPIISRIFKYFALKKQVEEGICSLKFDSTVILRPGPLVGHREHTTPNHTMRSILSTLIAEYTYKTPFSCLVGGSINATEVAAVGMFMIETSKYLKLQRIISSSEMIQLCDALDSI